MEEEEEEDFISSLKWNWIRDTQVERIYQSCFILLVVTSTAIKMVKRRMGIFSTIVPSPPIPVSFEIILGETILCLEGDRYQWGFVVVVL